MIERMLSAAPRLRVSFFNLRYDSALTSRQTNMRDEACYLCDWCGEEIFVPIDASAGDSQEYVEDCPVCCSPNVIHVEIDDEGEVRAWSERE